MTDLRLISLPKRNLAAVAVLLVECQDPQWVVVCLPIQTDLHLAVLQWAVCLRTPTDHPLAVPHLVQAVLLLVVLHLMSTVPHQAVLQWAALPHHALAVLLPAALHVPHHHQCALLQHMTKSPLQLLLLDNLPLL